nr:MAG TPA: hypothetical protein [Caudoviricetes sp.]
MRLRLHFRTNHGKLNLNDNQLRILTMSFLQRNFCGEPIEWNMWPKLCL